MELIRHFSQIGKTDAAIAGGKGASLGEMTQAGLAVPPGFVILASAFERFLEDADLNQEIDTIILHGVNREEMHTVERASEKIQQLILEAKMPEVICSSILQNYRTLGAEYVAVRSSATAEDSLSAAWAGQLDTFLNTTEENLLANVQKCWASLFTSRAIFYRFEKNMHDKKISVAVIVQKMIESEVSGIAFSVHPITQDANQMIVEAGFGLGEAIVSGQITPDSYVVEKNPRRIIDINITTQTRALIRANGSMGGNEWRELSEAEGKKPTLSNEQTLELSEIILNIENHYGFPCDIEWALEKGKFYITQSRPITTLGLSRAGRKNKYADINSDNYDFLWRVGFTYLATQLFYEQQYKGRDFVFVWNRGEHMNFVSKEERRRLSMEGIELYTTGFEDYRKRMEQDIPKYKEQMESFSAADLSGLSDDELASEFRDVVKTSLGAFDDYFYLDYHSTDEIGRVLVEGDERYNVAKLREEAEEMGRIKLRLRSIINYIFYPPKLLDKYAIEIGKRLGIDADTVMRHRYSELLDLLAGKKDVPTPRSGAVVWGKFSNNDEVTGEDAERIIAQLWNVDDSVESFKGQIGNKGVYRGRVKKVSFSSHVDIAVEIDAMKKGDVLVAGSTGPEMMVACNKAGAIVTEEGGVISHAAIVSRELGIPSIIGTKIATTALNDGDLVEVDANHGVVRILERAIP